MRNNNISVFSILIVLIECMVVPYSALGQMYFEDNFNDADSLDNWESLGGATWQVENGELVTRDSAGDWNAIILKEEHWQGWTDYSYELTVTPEPGSSFIYQVFRYTQALGTARTNFFSYLMDQDNAVLHIDRFLNGTRTRGVPGTSTFQGVWRNDTKHTYRIVSTKNDISAYLDDEKQFGPVSETNLIDGRIGIGVWAAKAKFDDVRVYGPDGSGIAVKPGEKKAAIWGQIKAQY